MAIKVQVVESILHIEIDVSEADIAEAPLSKSGKTKVVSTTSGFLDVQHAGLRLSLNLIAPRG